MPPKRKAAETSGGNEGVTTRATRSSARASASAKTEEKDAAKGKDAAAKPKTTKASASKKMKDEAVNDKDEPPTKKARTAKPKAAPKAAKGKKAPVSRDEPTEAVTTDSEPTHSAKIKPASKSATGTYTPAQALSLFETYADDDDPETIGPGGLERLCNDAEIPMDGTMPLILSWQLDAKEMGSFTKDEWIQGTSMLKVSSLPPLLTALSDLEKLLILDNSSRSTKTDSYDRTKFLSYAKDVKQAYHQFYMYCFNLAKPQQSRNIEMETSVALWSVVLSPKYPIMKEVISFIEEKEGLYKATTKDMWTMMLEFCETVKPDLQDYESDSAWPTLLDEFVAWKKTPPT